MEKTEKKERFSWISNANVHISDEDLCAKNVKFSTEIDGIDHHFEVNIQFKNYKEVLEYAVRRCVWNLQQKVQKSYKNGKAFLPENEVKTVDAKGNYTKTLTDQIREMNPEQRALMLKLMQEMMLEGK